MINQLGNTDTYHIVGHRGFKSNYPENTLLAIKEALDLGVDVLEFDLRFSKDKQLVVFHDDTLERTTDGSGDVGQYTLSELKQLDAGSYLNAIYAGLKIATLSELCVLLANYPLVLLNVEIKKDSLAVEAAARAIAMLKAHNLLQRCIFTSFDAVVITHIKESHGLPTQGFLADKMDNFIEGEQGTYSKMDSIGIARNLLTPELVAYWQNRGVVVSGYVMDTIPQIYEALNCGVRLITCDNPLPALQFRKVLRQEL